MAARSRFIDPATGDYEIVAGSPKEDATPASKVVLALRMRRGSCPVNPRLGSRLHEIRKVLPDTPRLASDYVREALSHLIDAGEIRELKVTATVVGTHTKGLHLVISYRDRSGTPRTQSLAV